MKKKAVTIEAKRNRLQIGRAHVLDQDKSCDDLLPVSCQSDEWKTSLQKTDNEYTKQCSCDASNTTCHGYTTDDCSTDSLKLKSGTTSRLNCSEDSGVCDRSNKTFRS